MVVEVAAAEVEEEETQEMVRVAPRAVEEVVVEAAGVSPSRP